MTDESSAKTRKKLSLFWKLNLAGWAVYGLTVYISFLPVLSAEGSPFRLLEIKGVRVVIGFALSLALREIYKKLWSKNPPLRSLALVAVFCSVAVGIAWLCAAQSYAWARNPQTFALHPLPRYTREALDYSYVMFGWSACYFGIKYWRDREQQKERALRADALANQAQIKMLRYQLNPHFLFNALNSIRASIDENPQSARHLVTEFSEFLRYSLSKTDASLVSLREEIEAMKNYLAIEKIRFDDRLEVLFDIEPLAMNCELPCFLLHPLIDNAIKHGLGNDQLPMTIKITGRAKGNHLTVEIANTGRWRESIEQDDTRIGLENIRSRLDQIYPQRSSFHVSEDRGWVRARIEIQSNGREQ